MRETRNVLVGLLAVALALVPAAAGRPAAAPSPATLLARHSPVLVLHPAERFVPVPVHGFLADSDLLRPTQGGWEKVEGPLPAGGADLRLDQRACSAHEGLAASPCYASAEAAHQAQPTVYGAAFRRGRRIVLQYWLWYPYDDYSPTVPAGDIWQVHEGDWEAVSVLLDLTGKPLLVGLSRHQAGARRAWSRAPKRGVRPLVYVGLGSHANFFAPGEHALDPRMVDPTLISIIRAYGVRPVDHAGRGRVIRPRAVRVTATSPRWMAFAGSWGEEAYVHFPGKEPIGYGAGPRGPAFHEQWRKPVGDVLSWPRR